MNIHHSNKFGQALIEVMVAISVLTIGFLGVIGLLSRALALNRVVTDNYVGTYLAAEGIEITKNIIDGNILLGVGAWNFENSVGDCLDGCAVDMESFDLSRSDFQEPLRFNSNTKTYEYGSGDITTTFRRKIVVTPVDQNELRVRSTVTWVTRGGGISTADLEDRFYHWR